MARCCGTSVYPRLSFAAALFFLTSPGVAAEANGFTIEQALSAPFCSQLRAAPKGEEVAWVANIGGRRNLWVALLGSDNSVKQVTSYKDDDGQEISDVEWMPNGKSLVYVRGGDTEGLNFAVPNPSDFIHGAKEQVWEVSASGGEPRLLGEGRSPSVSPDGKVIAFISKGQIWIVPGDKSK